MNLKKSMSPFSCDETMTPQEILVKSSKNSKLEVSGPVTSEDDEEEQDVTSDPSQDETLTSEAVTTDQQNTSHEADGDLETPQVKIMLNFLT